LNRVRENLNVSYTQMNCQLRNDLLRVENYGYKDEFEFTLEYKENILLFTKTAIFDENKVVLNITTFSNLEV
jgi:hypothetical protein